MSNKYLDSAIATFKTVINLLPNNKDACNHIGICYKEKGQIEESKFYFDRARDIRIGNKDAPSFQSGIFNARNLFSPPWLFQTSSLHHRHFPTLRIWMHSPSFHRSHPALRQGINAGLKSSDLLIQLTIEFFFMHQNDSMFCRFKITLVRTDCQGRCENEGLLKKSAFLFYRQFINDRNIKTIVAPSAKIEIQIRCYPLPRFNIL